MPPSDSALDQDEINRARALLVKPALRQSVWPVLGAATFAATAALLLASVMILAPANVTEHVVESAP